MTSNNKDAHLNRRSFFTRLFKAGLAISATGFMGYKYYDPAGPGHSQPIFTDVSFPDYSIHEQKNKLCIITSSDSLDRGKSIESGINALGGIEAFIKKNDNVLIKVNAAFATPPMLSATTHPESIEKVIKLCQKAGAGSIVVTDNPINDPISCFALSGIERVVVKNGAKIILPRKDLFKPLTLEKGSLIKRWPVLFDPFKDVHKVIAMAPVKDHHRSGASMILKNWYGLLGGRRNIFHQDIHNIIKELATMITPSLVILDGAFSMMKNGPTGGSLSDLKKTNTMIIGTDQVAADAFGAMLLEKTLQDLPFIKKAGQAGAGTSDFESLNPIRLTI